MTYNIYFEDKKNNNAYKILGLMNDETMEDINIVL